ncbi:dipeptidyl peptidase 4 [Caerostris extrusa]|uniref:Dipeptidyl peptidase 4 n=1 Tax=Caerostris extrusa TaxID=172846 RepID=A0AAV4U076_CAEEX|nr:dipeptidyl peptidase 4 [Caerostris extrusa]
MICRSNAPKDIQDHDYYLTAVKWIDDQRLLAIWLRRVQNSSIVSICQIGDSGWMCHKHSQEDTNFGWVDMYEAPVFSKDKRSLLPQVACSRRESRTLQARCCFDMAILYNHTVRPTGAKRDTCTL